MPAFEDTGGQGADCQGADCQGADCQGVDCQGTGCQGTVRDRVSWNRWAAALAVARRFDWKAHVAWC
ncbi:MAG: hypothetical protein H6729_05615 [Deltaproteobacteria bacterium]|nr:hypothetical protein [Deltaproteobacteria bacterium]